MDPVVVIPTFFSGKRRARRNSSVTGVLRKMNSRKIK